MKPALQPAQTITTSLTLAETTSMGVGAMVGAGIFALLGHAGSIAGSVVYISFILAGGISLLSGYSYSKLGVCFPSSGGIVEYLIRAFGGRVNFHRRNLLFHHARRRHHKPH